MGEPLDTVTYTYDGDILTSYDGKAVSGYQWGTYVYDGWTYETVRGNRLVRMSKWDYDANCEVARTFTYDANGMRTQRVEPDGTTYKYIYNGGLLSQMTVGSNTLYFTYDATGVPVSVILNGVTYYYVTNLQGDVVAIVDSHGGTVAKYVYDAWGNILDSSFFFRKKDPITGNYGYNEDTSANAIGRLNPLRYRGYVYDTETGWYYLQSRFYNPEWGRFITADSVDYLGADGTVASYNLFSYCSNNPVNISKIAFGNATITVTNTVHSNTTVAKLPGSVNQVPLSEIPWLINNATTIYGTYSALSAGIPIFMHYAKYAETIGDEFGLYGISTLKTSLQLSNVNLGMTMLDGAFLGINVGLDVYDSIQRGVSPEGVVMGGVLTAASGVGMLYLNKGIMWGCTTAGTAICPGVGTAAGFVAGLVISVAVDIGLGNCINKWIDKIAT